MKNLLLITLLALFSQITCAAWTLDNNASTFNFLSTKKNSVTEIHTFKKLKGSISDNGNAELAIILGSVETNIAIRNQRMHKMLFEVAKFSTATAKLTITPNQLNNLIAGERSTIKTAVTVNLHGLSKEINTTLAVTGLKNGNLEIHTIAPIIIKVEDFGLTAGIEKLRAVAKLPSIDMTVPVTFNLLFKKQ